MSDPSEPRPAVVVLSRIRHPHELMLLAWSSAVGASYLAGAPPPGSMQRMHPWVLLAWSWMLLVAGMVGLVGCLWRHTGTVQLVRALRLESGSMLLLTAGAGLYALAVLVAGGWSAVGAGGVLAAYALACGWRAVQISRDLRGLRGPS